MESFQYIDISSIDSAEKTIVNVATVSPSEAPSRARQLVQRGDVLVSTVRPNLNGVAIVPDNLAGATASTGFAVLRPDSVRLDSRYLYYWVRTPGFVREMTARATGASYPAVTDRVVRESRMPLPPLAEQLRIAAVLDKADAIRRKRRESLRLLDEFLRSAFLEMFGDPVRNDKGWQMHQVGDLVVNAQYGTSDRANSEHRGIPVLRMNNLTAAGGTDLSDMKWCEIPSRDLAKYTVRRGDLLFNRTNSPQLVGKTAVWDHDDAYAFAGYLVRVRFDESRILPRYVSGHLNSTHGKRMLFEKAKASNNMSNISASELKRLPIPVPPLTAQLRYVAVLERADGATKRMRFAGAHAVSLFSSLALRAFRGEA
jgi:type I restriction enzyme S subunit